VLSLQMKISNILVVMLLTVRLVLRFNMHWGSGISHFLSFNLTASICSCKVRESKSLVTRGSKLRVASLESCSCSSSATRGNNGSPKESRKKYLTCQEFSDILGNLTSIPTYL
jgi:hypothetical protein